MRAALGMTVGMLIATGCPREEPPPPPDRTLEKLKAEVDRANAGGAVVTGPEQPEDPNQKLAALAAGVASGRGDEGPLSLPQDQAPVKLGAIEVALVSAASAHQVKGKSMSLTSEELFLTVAVEARNTASGTHHFSIERAELSDGASQWRLARDAQVLAGTRELGFDLVSQQEREVTLVFEVPPSALESEQLVLSLPQPQGGNGDVRLRLK